MGYNIDCNILNLPKHYYVAVGQIYNTNIIGIHYTCLYYIKIHFFFIRTCSLHIYVPKDFFFCYPYLYMIGDNVDIVV